MLCGSMLRQSLIFEHVHQGCFASIIQPLRLRTINDENGLRPEATWATQHARAPKTGSWRFCCTAPAGLIRCKTCGYIADVKMLGAYAWWRG